MTAILKVSVYKPSHFHNRRFPGGDSGVRNHPPSQMVLHADRDTGDDHRVKERQGERRDKSEVMRCFSVPFLMVTGITLPLLLSFLSCYPIRSFRCY